MLISDFYLKFCGVCRHISYEHSNIFADFFERFKVIFFNGTIGAPIWMVALDIPSLSPDASKRPITGCVWFVRNEGFAEVVFLSRWNI